MLDGDREPTSWTMSSRISCLRVMQNVCDVRMNLFTRIVHSNHDLMQVSDSSPRHDLSAYGVVRTMFRRSREDFDGLCTAKRVVWASVWHLLLQGRGV